MDYITYTLRVSCVAVALLLTCATVSRAQETGEIRGAVTSGDGAALYQATVALDGEPRTATDLEGRFAIAGVPVGKHRVTVSYLGFVPHDVEIQVSPGVVARIEIALHEQAAQTEVVTVTASQSPYRSSISGTATKTTTPLMETPASVEIVNAARLDRQKVDRVDQIFDYMTGIVSGSGTRAQSYLLRGISVDDRFIPYQVDGVSGGVWRQHEPPAAIIERVEYLKGPASVLYGITQLGGVINYVTKKPQAAPAASIEIRHSSYASPVSPYGGKNSVTLISDMTGSLNADRSLRYRVVANHINNTSYRQDVEDYSLDLMPSVTWAPNETTWLNVSVNVNVDKGRWDEYLPVPKRDIARVPDIRTRINEPQDSYWDYGWGIGYILRRNLSDSWTIRSVGRHTSRIDGRKLFQTNGMVGDSAVSRRWRDQFNERSYSYLDITSELALNTGAVRHTILGGTTIGIEDIHFDRRNFQGDSTLTVNIYDPQHEAAPIYPAKPGFDRYWDNLLLGFYLQDQAAFLNERLHLVAGVQYIVEKTDHREARSGLTFDKSDAGVVPRLGLVILPFSDDVVSIYGSYSASLIPTNAERENAEGTIDFDTERGIQTEAGVKFNLFDARLGGSLSAFSLERKNALNPTGEKNLNGSTIYVQTGRERNRGVEIDLYAAPFDGLYLSLGYAANEAEILEDNNPSFVGRALPFVPDATLNFWSSYRFGNGLLDGLELGFGTVHVGDRPIEISATAEPFMLPAYTRYDAFISYALNRVTVGVNLNNLADERYFTGGDVLHLIPGAPRTLRTSFRVAL